MDNTFFPPKPRIKEKNEKRKEETTVKTDKAARDLCSQVLRQQMRFWGNGGSRDVR